MVKQAIFQLELERTTWDICTHAAEWPAETYIYSWAYPENIIPANAFIASSANSLPDKHLQHITVISLMEKTSLYSSHARLYTLAHISQLYRVLKSHFQALSKNKCYISDSWSTFWFPNEGVGLSNCIIERYQSCPLAYLSLKLNDEFRKNKLPRNTEDTTFNILYTLHFLKDSQGLKNAINPPGNE